MKVHFKLILRHKWIMLFVPVLIGFYLQNAANGYYADLYAGDIYVIQKYIISNFHLIVSILSVWWGIVFFSEFIGEQGNELLYMCFKPKQMIKSQIFIEVVYIFCFLVYFLCIRKTYELPFSVFFVVAAECLFMNGLSFFLLQWTRSSSVALAGVILYCVFLLKFDYMDLFKFISVFAKYEEILQNFREILLSNTAVAFAFHVAGGIGAEKRKVYF